MYDTPKEIVEQACNHIADWYLSWVDGQHSPCQRYTNMVLDNTPVALCVLELGCGPGLPIMRMLLDRGA